MTIKNFMKELNGNRVEGELIKTVLYSLITSLLTFYIIYIIKFKQIPDFMIKYGFYIFLIAISYSIIIPSIRQIRAYKELPCMSGMMVGMTIGMISGFLTGYYIGATNGMFTGSIFGMIIGITLGVINGKCCGIMGIMEGIMAGFMGGIMGAMTSVMLLNDNIKIASVIILAVSAVILFGLNFMIYKEALQIERKIKESYIITIVLNIILITLTTWVIAYGPRSVIFQ